MALSKASRNRRFKWLRFPYAWISLRKLAQAGALIFFFWIFLIAHHKSASSGWINLPMQLDPLLQISEWLSARSLVAGSLFALLTLAITLILGRVWCGWLCPLGTTLDLFAPGSRGRTKQASRIPEKIRLIKYLFLIAILFLAVFGSLTLLAFDPITILFRSLTLFIWPGLDYVFTATERFLYPLPFLAHPIGALESWLRPAVFPFQPAYFRAGLLFMTLLVGIISLNRLAPRFWCRYLCPLGGLLGWISRFSLFQRRIQAECKGCVLCERACPTGTIDPQNGYRSDSAECTMCLECLPACPRSAISFNPALPRFNSMGYDPQRRQFLATIGFSALAYLAVKTTPAPDLNRSHRLLPPGARADQLLSECLRCSQCIRACPSTALQPSLAESGLEGFWTPLFIPRLGYCDYACNACGSVCPTEAIPALSLEEKRRQVIGKAKIDQNRCIAWAERQDCIVCEEMCPLPEKAVYLEKVFVPGVGGDERLLQLPHIAAERCIGCGICEYKCPVKGEAAIRVYASEVTSL